MAEFDVDGARKAGYSDDEIASYLGPERGFDVGAARKSGYSGAEILQFLTKGETRTWGEFGKDMLVKGGQGVVGLGQSVIGLGDIVSGGLVGDAAKAIGYEPKRATEMLGDMSSDKQQRMESEIQNAGHGKGLVDSFSETFAAVAKNPSIIPGFVVESLPSMLAAGGGARALAERIYAKAATAAAAGGAEAAAAAGNAALEASTGALKWAAAAGEGAITAGQTADQAREAGRAWQQYVLPAIAAGVGTTLIGRAAGSIPGLGDAETAAFTGATKAAATGNRLVRTGKGLLQEGILEELPQSIQEQAWSNIAQGKPFDEGLGAAGAQGLVAGMAMGGAMGAASRAHTPEAKAEADTAKIVKDIGQAETVDDAIAAASQAPIFFNRFGAQEELNRAAETVDGQGFQGDTVPYDYWQADRPALPAPDAPSGRTVDTTLQAGPYTEVVPRPVMVNDGDPDLTRPEQIGDLEAMRNAAQQDRESSELDNTADVRAATAKRNRVTLDENGRILDAPPEYRRALLTLPTISRPHAALAIEAHALNPQLVEDVLADPDMGTKAEAEVFKEIIDAEFRKAERNADTGAIATERQDTGNAQKLLEAPAPAAGDAGAARVITPQSGQVPETVAVQGLPTTYRGKPLTGMKLPALRLIAKGASAKPLREAAALEVQRREDLQRYSKSPERQAQRLSDEARKNLHRAIVNAGGISEATAQEVGIDPKAWGAYKGQGLINKDGRGLQDDALAMLLAESKHILDENDTEGALQAVRDMLAKEFVGTPEQMAEYHGRLAAAHDEAEISKSGFNELAPAEQPAIADYDDSMIEAVAAIDEALPEESNTSIGQAMKDLGFTEQEIADVERTRSENQRAASGAESQGQTGGNEPAAAESRGQPDGQPAAQDAGGQEKVTAADAIATSLSGQMDLGVENSPAGSWALTDLGGENRYHVIFSLGGGQLTGGNAEATPQAAYNSALRLWTATDGTGYARAAADFKQIPKSKFKGAGDQTGLTLEAQTPATLAAKTDETRIAAAEDKAAADREREAFALQPQQRQVAPPTNAQPDIFGGPSVADIEAAQKRQQSQAGQPAGDDLFSQPEKKVEADPITAAVTQLAQAIKDSVSPKNSEQRPTPPVAESQAPDKSAKSPRDSGDGAVARTREGEAPITQDWRGQPWDGKPFMSDEKVDSKMLPGDIGTANNKRPWENRGSAVVRKLKDGLDNYEIVQVGKDAFVLREVEPKDEEPKPAITPETGKQAETVGGGASQTDGKNKPRAEGLNAQPVERIQDVGENLWANRRNFTGRGVSWDDVANLNDALKVREVVKAKVWPKPDYEKLIADGMPPIFARLLKQVYDGIATAPAAKADENLQRYIATIDRVRNELYNWAKDGAANRQFMNAVASKASVLVGAERGERVSLSSLGGADFTNALLDRIWPNDASVSNWRRFARGSDANKEINEIGGNRALKHLQFSIDDVMAAMKDLDKGWPKSQEAWQRQGYKVAPSSQAVVKEGRRYRRGEDAGTPIWSVLTKDSWGGRTIGEFDSAAEAEAAKSALKPFMLLDKRDNLISQHDTEEAAKEAARQATKREGKGGDIRGMNIAESERSGPERRAEGENVSAKDLQDKFGFRGVNFGREGWINQAERQEYLNQAHDALIDLAEIMDIPPKAISLNGTLGIAFGAQGRGGSAAAHFVPGVNEINLTKTMGAGTLAHEWGHALDHYFATQAGLAKNGEPFLSAHISNNIDADGYTKLAGRKVKAFSEGLRPEITAMFKRVVDAMEKRPMTEQEMKAREESARQRAARDLEKWIAHFRKDIERTAVDKEATLKEFDAIADRMRKGDEGEGFVKVGGQTLRQLTGMVKTLVKEKTKGSGVHMASNYKGLDSNAHWMAYTLSEKAATSDHVPQTTSTTYAGESSYKDQQKGGKAYWRTRWEMFARAFETYVADALEKQSRQNTFLSDALLRADAKDDSGKPRMPYPRGEERTTIAGAMESLVDAIETSETEGGNIALASRGNNDEVERAHQLEAMTPVDAAKFVRMDQAFGEYRSHASEVVKTADGSDVTLTVSAGKKMRNHGASPAMLSVIGDAKHLLENSFRLWSAPERNPKAQSSVRAYHHYGVKALIDGEPMYVRYIVREMPSGEMLYDGDAVLEKQNPRASVEASPVPNREPQNSEGAQSIAQWLDFVKNSPAAKSRIDAYGTDQTAPEGDAGSDAGTPVVREPGEEGGEPDARRSGKPRPGIGRTRQAVREELVSAYGETGIANLEREGVLWIGRFAEAPKSLTRQLNVGDEGAYWNGTGYIFTDNLARGQAPSVLLHEVGEHFGLEEMLGQEAYRRMINQVKAMHAAGNIAITEAWNHVKRHYKEPEGSDRFMHEVIAKAGQDADVQKMGWFKRMLTAIRAFMIRHGFANVTSEKDLQALMLASLNKAMKDAGTVTPISGSEAMAAKDEREPWYSELSAQIKGARLDNMPAAQWKAFIANLTAKGVKKDEIQWSGVSEWLDGLTGKVAKADVMGFLDQNGVQVTETTLGDFDQVKFEIVDDGVDPDKYRYSLMVNGVEENRFTSREAAEEEVDILKNDPQTRRLYKGMGGSIDTKFGQYQLPGGENYRELLLTLPRQVEEMKYPEPLKELPPGYEIIVNRGASNDQAPRYGVIPPGQAHAQPIDGRWFQTEAAARESMVGILTRLNEQNNVRYANEWNARNQAGQFRSSHFDQPNILAHIRFNERTDADGKKVLFIEEIQSDWAQKGKKEGFQGGPDEYRAEHVGKWAPLGDEKYRIFRNGQDIGFYQSTTEAGAINEARARNYRPSVPAAPFVGKTEAWVALSLKRMIRYAAENGFDRVAWTNGEQQAARYDLSKQIKNLDWSWDGQEVEIQATTVDGRPVSMFRERGELSEAIGKELAAKIDSAIEAHEKFGTYTGLDLKLGGEGMRAFYDKIVPNVANDVLKKLGGGRVGEVGIHQKEANWSVEDGDGNTILQFSNESAAEAYADRQRDDGQVAKVKPPGLRQAQGQPGFDITPSMREKAMAGMPMFSRMSDQLKGLNKSAADGLFKGEPEIDKPMSPRAVANAFNAIVKKIGYDDLNAILGDWNGSELNEEGDKIIYYPGRDRHFSKGKDGGKVTIPKSEFLDWLGSDEALDVSAEKEWRDMIEAARSAVDGGAPMASRSAPADIWEAMQSAKTAQGARDTMLALLDNPNKFNLWDKTIGTQLNKAKKNTHFKRVFDALQRQQDDTAAFAIEAEAEAIDVLARMNGKAEIMAAVKSTVSGERAKDLAAVSKAIFSNIEGREGVRQVVYTDAQLADQFGMNERQIGMYRQSRDAIDRSLDRYAQSIALKVAQKFVTIADLRRGSMDDTVEALTERMTARRDSLEAMKDDSPGEILRSLSITHDGQTRQEYVRVKDEEANIALEKEIAALDAALEKIGEIQSQAESLKQAGYAPAMRFGDYAVTGYTPNRVHGGQDVEFFRMTDTKTGANALRLQLQKQHPNWKIEVSPVDKESFKLFRGISPDTVELFARFMDVEQDAAFKEYIALATSSRSAMKRMLERKGIAGFSDNLPRVLSAFITSNSRAAAQNLNGFDINDAFEAIPQNQGDVRSEAAKLIDYLRNPTDDGAKVRGFLFSYFMGGSVASALVNLTQPVMMTAPYLHQFAGNKTATIMGRAGKMAATGTVTDAEMKAAFQRAEAEGVTDAHEYHQLMQEAEGGGSVPTRAVMKAWGSLFGAAEKFNRRITFLAAYEVAQGMTRAQIKAAGSTDAYGFAKDAVAETQGIYNKANRPNWARGTVGALLFTFKQFSIAYLEFFSRLPRKQQLLALGMLVLAAGAEGLPFAEDLEDLIDTIGQKLGYGTNTKKTLRKMATNALGEAGAQFALHGLSGISGIPMDVAGRLGMGNLLPGTKLLNPSVKDKGREYAEVLGAAGGLAQKALGAVDQGKVAEAMPKAFSDAAKAFEMVNSGEYRDTRGRKVMATDSMDAAMKLIGFQPASVASANRHITEQMRDVDTVKRVESEIADQWADGIRNKSTEETAAARARLKQWNEDNPDMPIKITMSQVIRRVKQANLTRDQRFMKTATPEMRRQMLREATH